MVFKPFLSVIELFPIKRFHGLTSYGITDFTRKVAIVDTYDAITSDRVYQKGRSHLTAINILAKCRDTHFDAGLVRKFVECIGIYPLGSLVELNTVEVGIVAEVTPKTRMTPKLLTIMDKNKQLLRECMLDLANPSADGAKTKLFSFLFQRFTLISLGRLLAVPALCVSAAIIF